VGSSVVIVDALDEAAAGFYAAHGFVRLPDSLRLVIRRVKLGGDLNMMPLPSPHTPGKRPGNQIRKGIRLRGSKRICDVDTSSSGFTRSLEAADYDSFGVLPMLKVAVRPPRHAPCRFPHASPVSQTGAGKQKAAPRDRSNPLISFRRFGAGEGIRTLDPNLGKVVLYP
jgi:hypothetical protein